MSEATFPPDEYLSPEEVETLHDILTEQLNGLLRQSKEAIHDLTDVRSADADALDLAVTESNRDFSLRLADRERRLMSKIRLALGRIAEGEYGVCESCGAPITYKRLLARPVATLCIDCKTEAEQLERRKKVF
ncbi:MAG: RNA polymerase-binding protein DksA [Myxococcota bacterium]